jgi:hypothetical protein
VRAWWLGASPLNCLRQRFDFFAEFLQDHFPANATEVGISQRRSKTSFHFTADAQLRRGGAVAVGVIPAGFRKTKSVVRPGISPRQKLSVDGQNRCATVNLLG